MNLNNFYKSIKSEYPQYNHDSIVQAMKKELTVLNTPESLRVLANWDIHKDNLNEEFDSSDKPKGNSNAPTNQWNFNEGSNSQNKFEVKTVNNYEQAQKRKDNEEIVDDRSHKRRNDKIDDFFMKAPPSIIIPEFTDEFDELPLYMNSHDAVIDTRPLQACTYVGDLNISIPFINFINDVKEVLSSNGFFLETHFFEICVLSSILPLKKNQYSKSLLKHFKLEQLNEMQDRIMESLVPGYKTIEFNVNVLQEIRTHVKSFVREEITFRKLRSLLDALCDKLTDHESRVVDALINIISNIPKEPVSTPLGEIEFQSGYLQPVLGALFNNKDENIMFRWPDKITQDAKDTQVNKRRRPDGQVTQIEQSVFGLAYGYAEAKVEERRGDVYEMTRDLIRISLFDKMAIDKHNLEGNLGIQCIGTGMTFYVMQLIGHGIYPFVEFAEAQVPMSHSDLADFLNDFDQLLLVVKVFNKCKQRDETITQDMKRESFDSPSFRTYVSSTKDRRRASTLNFK